VGGAEPRHDRPRPPAPGRAAGGPIAKDAMRVLHVLPWQVLGGAEIATRRLATAVRPMGVESVAWLLRPTPEMTAFFEGAGIPCVTDVRRPEPSLVRDAPQFLRDSRAAARLLAKFDIVHCADTPGAWSVAVAGRLARRPVLCHVRNRETQLSRRDQVFIRAAHHFTFVSEETRRAFPIRLPQPRTSVLYDGVEIPAQPGRAEAAAIAAQVRAELGLPSDALTVAMFARLNPQKDFETVIRAAAILRDRFPALRFLMVGDNALEPRHREYFEQVRQAAAAAGVLDRLVFTGFRDDTHRLMIAADICLLCTHFEGFPLSLIEAMAAGRPCIATAVDGIPEALTHGVSGLLHAHQDADGLAAAIAQFAADRDLAERMGAAARAEAERRFSRQRFARDVLGLYQQIVREHAGLQASRVAVESSVTA